ncbi:unnamed protein product [Linum trigynum]|uniref:Uncharacterized protein n=1 Tax=Linum trigynum TaxID=586398 RepID=A0AAV2E4A3_9ROSI
MEDSEVAFRDDFYTAEAIASAPKAKGKEKAVSNPRTEANVGLKQQTALPYGGDCPKHSNRRISASSQSPPPMMRDYLQPGVHNRRNLQPAIPV